MRGPQDGYVAGVTIFVGADGKFSFFENGLRQNVLFLYRLFAASPRCRAVYLINHGDAEPSEDISAWGIAREKLVRASVLPERLDYLIVIGAAVDRATIEQHRRAGTRIVAYKGGNGAVISMEAMAARPPRGDAERYFDHDYYDAVWITPQHMATYAGWCRTLYRVPVQEIPQIWEPLFVKHMTGPAASFGYRPGSAAWRVGIMDPNVTVMKTSHLPMMVCEAAYRQYPDMFKAIYVTNGLAHKDNAHFMSFAAAMTAAQNGVMTIEPRFVGPQFIANHADAVVTHHWENGLNYLYYEALWGGYPLIHNSAFLHDYGYYYPGFDAYAGAEALTRAFADHDRNLDAYRSRCTGLFERLRPSNPETIDLHESVLPGLE